MKTGNLYVQFNQVISHECIKLKK